MFSLVGGSIHKTKIAYGCVLLLGSASVAGVAVGDSKGSWFSSLSQKISGVFAGGGSGSAGSAVSDRENGLVAAWQWVAETGKSVFDWAIEPTAVAFTQIHKTYTNWWTGLKTFFGSLVTRDMYTMLFRNFHTKIYNTLSFFLAGGQNRKTFIDLFRSDKIQNTLKAGRFLLGAEQVKGFRAEQNLFNFLLFNWLENPTKVTGKFQRLSDYVTKIGKKNWGSGAGGVGTGASGVIAGDDKIYTLTTKTTQEYLNVEEGVREKWWLYFLSLQVKSKLETGKSSDTLLSGFSWFTSAWDSIFSNIGGGNSARR